MLSASPQLPRFWLFTDERLGSFQKDALLWKAINRLPEGGGIIFRHYSLRPEQREALFQEVKGKAELKQCVVLGSDITSPHGQHLSGSALAAAKQHKPDARPPLVTAACHSLADLKAAPIVGAHMAFLSPVFSTRSHPGSPALGPAQFKALVEQSDLPVIALGGMDRERFEQLRTIGAYGFAAIDYWAR